MRFTRATAAAVLAFASTALGSAVVEKLSAVPSGWEAVGEPAADQKLSLQVALTQSNIDQLESKLMGVSTPGDANYGKHWTREQVNDFFKPSAESHDAVVSWLKDAGVKTMHSDGHIISFTTSVANANKLLSTKFQSFSRQGVSKIRTLEYSVPDELADHVDLIAPTTYFSNLKRNLPTPHVNDEQDKRDTAEPISPSCEEYITPACAKELYSVGDYVPNPKSGSTVGFGSFLNESAIYNDLFDYENLNKIPKQSFTVSTIAGGANNQSIADSGRFGEADLDVQNIIGLSHPLPVHEFITGGSPPFVPNLDEPDAAANQNEPYLPYYQYLLAQKNLPKVISNSYGDDEQTVPPKYAARVCNMIGQVGMRGISVLESAGDVGVGDACRANDGSNKLQFTPQFPGTCPYITAVGGTQAVSPEISWNTTSGGFSFYFARPRYQDQAINDYFEHHIAPSTLHYYVSNGFFRKDGRGFPDVAAHSLFPRWQFIFGGQEAYSGGTSAAAPATAGIVALLNDVRLSHGKPALGFLNPWIYGGGYKYLNDITSGVVIGCTGENLQEQTPIPGGGIIPYATWNGTVGWDPTTGWGTPNFAKLRQAVLRF